MKKQYMDFVPAKSIRAARTPGVQRQKVVRTMPRARVQTVERVTEMIYPEPEIKVVDAGAMSFSEEREPTLGVVEELSPRFVKTDVPKRPLGQASHFQGQKSGIAGVKAQKIGNKGRSIKVEHKVEKPVENSHPSGGNSVYQTPRTPFINQGKVQKRPLSGKNTYTKKIETPKEVSKGPVTIISKPEKQAHTGMIITIILTIILGAAAGTVAFLLLPK